MKRTYVFEVRSGDDKSPIVRVHISAWGFHSALCLFVHKFGMCNVERIF